MFYSNIIIIWAVWLCHGQPNECDYFLMAVCCVQGCLFDDRTDWSEPKAPLVGTEPFGDGKVSRVDLAHF